MRFFLFFFFFCFSFVQSVLLSNCSTESVAKVVRLAPLPPYSFFIESVVVNSLAALRGMVFARLTKY